jgi:hypothetical protein
VRGQEVRGQEVRGQEVRGQEVRGPDSGVLRTARRADPHDVQPGSLGRLPLASIRGDEWDAEVRRGLELESGRNVQRVERP